MSRRVERGARSGRYAPFRQPDVVEAQGANVGEVLNNLKTQASGIEGRLFKGANQLNRFVNVYLNDEDVRYLDNLQTAVKDGDEVSIIPAVAGG